MLSLLPLALKPEVWLFLSPSRLTLKDVVKTTVFLADLADFQEMNRAYAEFFPGHPPARSTVQVAGLPRGASIEI